MENYLKIILNVLKWILLLTKRKNCSRNIRLSSKVILKRIQNTKAMSYILKRKILCTHFWVFSKNRDNISVIRFHREARWYTNVEIWRNSSLSIALDRVESTKCFISTLSCTRISFFSLPRGRFLETLYLPSIRRCIQDIWSSGKVG